MMASMPGGGSEIDDDEIDASAEASALGSALPTSVIEPPDPWQETSSKNGSARRSSGKVRSFDETQIDPEAPQELRDDGRDPPPIVARDEMPKRMRVVSASGSRPPPPPPSSPSSSSLLAPPPAPHTVERSAPRARERSSSGVLPRAQPLYPQRPATGPIVIAALLGVVIGAGIVGIGWLAAQSTATTVMFVATPRQTEVRLGDTVLCAQTPCAVLLEPGKHDIRFKAPGAEELARTVEVKASGTPPIEVALERPREDLRLETSPPGAAVSLDDHPLPGLTPMTLPRLTVGASVRLKMTHEGFEPFEVNRTVDVEPVWRYELPTSYTAWTVTTEPADALIDGPGRDQGGKVVVTAGTKKAVALRITRPGCAPRTVQLLSDGKAEGEQKIVLDCKQMNAGLFIKAPRRALIKVDGTELPRSAQRDPYRLPAGTWNISIKSRGHTEVQTVELPPKKLYTLTSKLR